MADDIPENIDRFNRLTLATLSLLYEYFPNPIEIDSKILGINASGDNFEGEGGGERAFTWMGSARDTLNWLSTESFLRHDGTTLEGGFHRCVLTAKGLATLGHIPHSIKENPAHESVASLAQKTLKSGAKDVISDFVKEIISIGIRAYTGI
jgi:hypothetical protein